MVNARVSDKLTPSRVGAKRSEFVSMALTQVGNPSHRLKLLARKVTPKSARIAAMLKTHTKSSVIEFCRT